MPASSRNEIPSSSASSLNPSLRQQDSSAKAPASTPEELIQGIRSGDRSLLSRAITLIESRRPDHRKRARAVVEGCVPHAGESLRVAVTGIPGVGKSTFIETLGLRLVNDEHRVAVLAIDPSSERSKGSILGDKTRMEQLAASERAFIRPSPTGGALGGVAQQTRETILLCEAAGYDVVFVETVGVGQAEVTAHSMVDFFLLLAIAGGGDELQGIKRGIMEMADAIAINKADGENAERSASAAQTYEQALHLMPPRPSGWSPRVLTCSALTGDGVGEVWETIETYREYATEHGYFEENRRQQARHWMYQTVERRLRERFFQDERVQQALPDIEEAILEGTMSSFAGAEKLLGLHLGEETSSETP